MMSYPKPPQELIDKWIVEYTYKILNGTYLQPNGEQKVDWYSVMEKYGEWCADDELEACCQLLYDRFSSVTDEPNPVALELKEWLFASRRKTNNLLTITVNDIPLKITAEQESQINKILNIQNATD